MLTRQIGVMVSSFNAVVVYGIGSKQRKDEGAQRVCQKGETKTHLYIG